MLTVFGNVELDLREARIAMRKTIIHIFASSGRSSSCCPLASVWKRTPMALMASLEMGPDTHVAMPPDPPRYA